MTFYIKYNVLIANKWGIFQASAPNSDKNQNK